MRSSEQRSWGWGHLISAALLGPALVATPARTRAYVDRPPVEHTGGFGEPSCRRCHLDNPLDSAGGSLEIAGVPEYYRPGYIYVVTVTLQRNGMRRAGFQLSVRFREGDHVGDQAGRLQALDASVDVSSASSGVLYAQHTPEGSRLDSREHARAVWSVEWRSPPAASGSVVFHVAANAANDDDSELGDFVYVQEILSRAPISRP